MVTMVLPWDTINSFKEVIINTLLPQVEEINSKLEKVHTRLDKFEQKLDQIRKDVNIEGRVHNIEDITSNFDHRQRDMENQLQQITQKEKGRRVAV